jgi:hypothetical protein
MANTRNQNLFNTVRGSLGKLTGDRKRNTRGRGSRGGGGLASQASGFIGGLLSGGDSKSSRGRSSRRGRSASRARSRSAGRHRR